MNVDKSLDFVVKVATVAFFILATVALTLQYGYSEEVKPVIAEQVPSNWDQMTPKEQQKWINKQEKEKNKQEKAKRKYYREPSQFTVNAPINVVKPAIVKYMMATELGYSIQNETSFSLSFTRLADAPVLFSALFIPPACQDMSLRKFWTFSLTEDNGVTTITPIGEVEVPGDYCHLTRRRITMGYDDGTAFERMLNELKPPVPAGEIHK